MTRPYPQIALFERKGTSWLPQPACVGPWSADLLHGGPVAALCIAVAEEMLPEPALITTRLTIDLVRPVPARPLEVAARMLKSGRRVKLLEIEIAADGRQVAFAHVQRLLRERVELPPLEGSGLQRVGPPDRPADFGSLSERTDARRVAPFLDDATDMRTMHPGGIFGSAPTDAWINVFAELTPGVPLSPTAAVCAACDYSHAIGSPMAPGDAGLSFPNADLCVYLVREPASAWVRLAPESTWDADGIGHTRCALADERGMLGTSAMTLAMANARAALRVSPADA